MKSYRLNTKLFLFLLLAVLCFPGFSQVKKIVFSNLTWIIRDGIGDPAHNNWSNNSNNVWIDANGSLHLKITYVNGKWYCAGIYSEKSFGFGQFWFETIGRLDQFDPNITLALFSYPTPSVGPDTTNEIDIEFSRWGDISKNALNLSFTTWPTTTLLGRTVMSYHLIQAGDHATYGYTWSKDQIYFQSGNGHHLNYHYPIVSWLFNPPDYAKRIPQQPLPVHLYLYLFSDQKPIDGKEVEVIIRKFCYKSLDGKQSNHCKE